MALTTFTLTGDLVDLIGSPPVAVGTETPVAWVTIKISGDYPAVRDPAGKKVFLSPTAFSVTEEQLWKFSHVLPHTDAGLPAPRQYVVTVRAYTRAGHVEATFGPFSAAAGVASLDLAGVESEAELPPDRLTGAELQAAITEAEAARDGAEAAYAAAQALIISDLGTTDEQTRALVEALDSQTRAALDAIAAIHAASGDHDGRYYTKTQADGRYDPAGAAGTAASASVPKSLIDAKGDLIVGTGADTVGRLAAGANGRLLLPDSTQASGWRYSTAAVLEGAGAPEGVVAASVGSRYTDLNATSGAVSWIKASGAGTTGWRVTYGDTGWRRIDALLGAGWALAGVGPRLWIRRVNSKVHIDGRVRAATDGAMNSRRAIFTLPSGFEADPVFSPLVSAATYSSSIPAILEGQGDLNRIDVLCAYAGAITAGSTELQFVGEVLTAAPWPATLPGTAV